MKYTFSSVITKEGKWHVAHCVELGVASQGKTIEEAQQNLKEAVELYLEGSGMPPNVLPHGERVFSTLEITHA